MKQTIKIATVAVASALIGSLVSFWLIGGSPKQAPFETKSVIAFAIPSTSDEIKKRLAEIDQEGNRIFSQLGELEKEAVALKKALREPNPQETNATNKWQGRKSTFDFDKKMSF
jgi:Skp family chaperone for outer membrane proteins